MTVYPARRVLIVDDEEQVGSLISHELSEHGFACCATSRGDHAKTLIDQRPPDVLIADIKMPGTTGLDLLAYAKKRSIRCKVILITGGHTREYLAQSLLLGAYDYIEKPFKPGEILEVVTRAVNGGADSPVLLEKAAAAMELSSQNKQASLDSVKALVRAVEAKDPFTRRHSEQVAHYAVNLARAMSLDDDTVESVRVASLLHDIGKIGVPDHILTKPGPLSDDEFQYIRRHPALGSDILASVAMFRKEAQLVRHHHERWDGTGYPDGLAGEEIPLASRIIQLADSIDAMLMDRTYKRGYSVTMMLGELVRCAGTQFDPRIAAAAVTWCQSHPEALFLTGKASPKCLEVA